MYYAELQFPPLKYLVIYKQRKFFHRLWEERQFVVDNPRLHDVKVILAANTSIGKYIDSLIINKIDGIRVG